MKYLVYLVVFGFVFSCAKHTRPRKTNRILTEGKWLIVGFVDEGKNLIKSYKNVSLSFGDNGEVLTTSQNNVNGEWYLGTNRNPAVIYMSFPENDSMNVISDDWAVYKLTSKECILKRNLGTTDTKEKIDYDAVLDNLTLVKN
jgi:hypothetical protein